MVCATSVQPTARRPASGLGHCLASTSSLGDHPTPGVPGSGVPSDGSRDTLTPHSHTEKIRGLLFVLNGPRRAAVACGGDKDCAVVVVADREAVRGVRNTSTFFRSPSPPGPPVFPCTRSRRCDMRCVDHDTNWFPRCQRASRWRRRPRKSDPVDRSMTRGLLHDAPHRQVDEAEPAARQQRPIESSDRRRV